MKRRTTRSQAGTRRPRTRVCKSRARTVRVRPPPLLHSVEVSTASLKVRAYLRTRGRHGVHIFHDRLLHSCYLRVSLKPLPAYTDKGSRRILPEPHHRVAPMLMVLHARGFTADLRSSDYLAVHQRTICNGTHRTSPCSHGRGQVTRY